MAEDKPAPTEEQIKAANEAQEAKWQGDFKEEDLTIPYKRENKSESAKGSKDSTGNNTGGGGDSNEEDEEEDNSPKEVEQYSEPAPALTVEDPGDYKPADYSFEVTLKDGKTVKVTTPEEAEKLADDPDNFETPKQLMDFINKQNKMQRNLDRDYEKWESQHKTFTEQLKTETDRRKTVDNYVAEFQYLVDKGKLPPVAKEYLDADWSDPEVAKQPGVKEQMALLNYMIKENNVRTKANIKPLTSVVDAYYAWKEDEGEQEKAKEAEEAKKAAGEARKTASARVAGVSPAQQGSYVPKGIAVGNPNVFKRGAAVWDD